MTAVQEGSTAADASLPISVQDRIKQVIPPTPVLSRQASAELTDRQREILDELVAIFDQGFSDLTMADIASNVGCSLRTLYSLAAGREELVLVVVDRNLWRIGRAARDAIRPGMRPLDAIRAYLRAANVAVARTTEAFASDTAAIPEAQALNDAHSAYLIDVTRALLDDAVAQGDIARCNTAAVARVIAGLGREFARPHVLVTLRSSPKKAADDMVDVILAGLPRPEAP